MRYALVLVLGSGSAPLPFVWSLIRSPTRSFQRFHRPSDPGVLCLVLLPLPQPNCRTGVTGRGLAGSGIGVYGPRTTISLALRGPDGAHNFLLVDDVTARDGQWVQTVFTFTAVGYARRR